MTDREIRELSGQDSVADKMLSCKREYAEQAPLSEDEVYADHIDGLVILLCIYESDPEAHPDYAKDLQWALDRLDKLAEIEARMTPQANWRQVSF